jgi:hypothetical protein
VLIVAGNASRIVIAFVGLISETVWPSTRSLCWHDRPRTPGTLLELEIRLAADAMREQLEEIRQALYRRIDYNLAWLLRKGSTRMHKQIMSERHHPSVVSFAT